MIRVLDTSYDEVIKSVFSAGVTTYAYALENISPLLDRFSEQRKAQSKKFYERLRADIISGCVMPPITIAFVSDELSVGASAEEVSSFVNREIPQGYILDGMQRMLSLRDSAEMEGFQPDRPIYLNIVIAEKYDLLLYRMITLNNGQKPMTARHQIEMLTKGALDLSTVKFTVATEKQTENTKITNAFRMSDVAEAYTAYLSNSLHNQNSKIIESKLDEILVGRVMSSDVTSSKFSFSEIMTEVGRLQQDTHVRDWLRQLNNLIGFTVGAKTSLSYLQKMSPSEMHECIVLFEKAFDLINPSKVNVGKFRRELSAFFIRRIDVHKDTALERLEELFVEETITD